MMIMIYINVRVKLMQHKLSLFFPPETHQNIDFALAAGEQVTIGPAGKFARSECAAKKTPRRRVANWE